MAMTRVFEDTSGKYKEFNSIIDKAVKEINSTDIIEKSLDCKQYNILRIPSTGKTRYFKSLIGVCFDYLCRIGIHKLVYKKKGIYNKERYVFHNLIYSDYRYKYYSSVPVEEYENEIDNFIKDNNKNIYDIDFLIKYVWCFSCLEGIHRNEYNTQHYLFCIHELTSNNYEIYREELKSLYYAGINDFNKKFNLSKANIIYNPTFGKITFSVHGADGDIIINDTLIDFKTSVGVDFTFTKQLLGYYLFNNYYKKYKINKICIYYARRRAFIIHEFSKYEKRILNNISKEFNECVEELHNCELIEYYNLGYISLEDVKEKYIGGKQ